MEFITTGNQIAVENFVIGYFYTITMLSGNYFQACCTGIGSDFVMFSRDEPDLLFSLTLQSAADVSSIELYGGGSGTNDYNDLSNKPQLNGVTLIGNKSLFDLGIQDIISDLDTIRSGAAAGATSVQPAAMSAALATKQDTLSSAQLAAVNSGIDSTKVAQIEINKNNISIDNKALKNCINSGQKNYLPTATSITGELVSKATISDDGTITIVLDTALASDGSVKWEFALNAGTYIFSCGENSNIDGPYDSFISDLSTTPVTTVLRDNSRTPGQTATISTGNYRCTIRIRANAPVGTYIFKPMLAYPDTIAVDSSYQPYAMTNAEITAWILAHS